MPANSLSHTSWDCSYHIVFVPKYQRKVLFREMREDVGRILRKLCEYKGVELNAAAIKEYIANQEEADMIEDTRDRPSPLGVVGSSAVETAPLGAAVPGPYRAKSSHPLNGWSLTVFHATRLWCVRWKKELARLSGMLPTQD